MAKSIILSLIAPQHPKNPKNNINVPAAISTIAPIIQNNIISDGYKTKYTSYLLLFDGRVIV